MIWTIVGILLVLWVLGFITNVAGAFIHLLLFIAAITLIIKYVSARPERMERMSG